MPVSVGPGIAPRGGELTSVKVRSIYQASYNSHKDERGTHYERRKLNEELGAAFRRVVTERRKAINIYLDDLVEGCILLLSVPDRPTC
jgi:hypothetical protein